MCSCFFLHLGTKKWQANQPCGILATSKGTLCHNLLNFRVKAWVKLWVRLRITQVVFMVMVWEHLQETNPSVCNVLTSDENKVPACATCLPSEFLYPVLYNISRPHWFWNKHLPSRELGPPAKFVWSSTRASFAFSGNTCLRCDQCNFHELFSPSLMAHGELGEHWLSGKTYIKQELLVTIQIDWSSGLKRSSTPGLVLLEPRCLPGCWLPANRKWQEGRDTTFLLSTTQLLYKNACCVATIHFFLLLVVLIETVHVLILTSWADLYIVGAII